MRGFGRSFNCTPQARAFRSVHACGVQLSFTGVVFQGRTGNDELVIDFAGGSPLLAAISFLGGTGSDTVKLQGLSGSATSLAYNVSTTAVSLVMDGGLLSTTGVERFVDSLTAANRTFTLGSTDDRVTFTNVGTTTDGQTQFALTGGPSVEFKNPTTGLTLNAGAGRDTVDVTSVDNLFTSGFQINGGDGDDQLNVSLTRAVSLSGDAGNDSLTGGSGADTLNGGLGNDTLIGGAGNDSLLGGAGDDVYVFAAATVAGEIDTLTELAAQGNDRLDFGSLAATINVTANLSSDTALATHANRTVRTAATGQAPNFERVTGGAGNDSLTGNAVDNQLDGGAGNDTLTGSAGNDTLTGGAGSDSLVGNAGNDVYIFGVATASEIDTVIEVTNEGTDLLDFTSLVATDPVTANLASATTTLATHINRSVRVTAAANLAFFENLIGGLGNDTLTGNAGGNRIEGGAGNDNITGGAGNDTLLGGLDNDTYVFAVAASAETDVVTELTNAGTDLLDFSSLTSTVAVTVNLNNDTALATHANRTINTGAVGQAANFENMAGGAANDSLTGNAANNRLTGNAGNDALFGGLGDDVYVFAAATVAGEIDTLTELANAGNDQLDFSALASTIAVTVNLTSDTALATHTNRTVKTALTGQAANFEQALGGAGNDSLTGNNADNRLDGGAGNDTLRGNIGQDTLIGGIGSDSLLGGAGNDLYLFAVTSATETDTLTELSNEGTDRLDFSLLASTIAVNVNLGSDTALAAHTNRTVRTAVVGQFANFEEATGGAGDDSLAGNASNNRLEGGLGNDTLRGLAGNDTLFGDAGSDALVGSTGDDVYFFTETTIASTDTLTELANEGTDVLDFSTLTTAVVVNLTSDTALATHTNRIVRTVAAGQAANFEGAIGGSGNDSLTGNAANNLLSGGAGNDTLMGGLGADTLDGGADNDVLDGEAGTDSLSGGTGRDLLIGGVGIDILSGGADEDILIGGTASLSGNSVALTAIMAEWTSANTYVTRIANLLNGGGANGSTKLNASTVQNDANAADTLNGSLAIPNNTDIDWFFQSAGDVLDAINGEVKTAI